MSLVEEKVKVKYKSMIISAYLLRNIAYVFNYEEFVRLVEKSLLGRKIRIKWGIDPSSSDMHIGHFVCLRQIKEMLRSLPSVEICIVIGTATVLMHDPSGKSTINYSSSKENELSDRSKRFKDSISAFLGNENVRYCYNHEWITKMDVLHLLSILRRIKVKDILQKFKVQNMALSSAVYPAFQAYDSFYLESDIEIGEADQLTNVLLARELSSVANKQKQVAVLMPLIHDVNGQKMSKSSSSAMRVRKENIGEMFRNIMSSSDEVFMQYLNLLANKRYEIKKLSDIQKVKRDFCMDLFSEIFSQCKQETEEALISVDKSVGDEMLPIRTLLRDDSRIIGVICQLMGISSSSSRRLLSQRAIHVNGRVVEKNEILPFDAILLIQVGKKRFKLLLYPA